MKFARLSLIILFLVLIIISGCTKYYIKITKEEYTTLKYTQEQYTILSNNYSALKIQQNQCKNQLENVSNTLYNTLQFKEPFTISIPIIGYQKIITYNDAGKIAKKSFWISLITLLTDLVVGFFFHNIDKKKWITSISLLGLTIILVYIIFVFS